MITLNPNIFELSLSDNRIVTIKSHDTGQEIKAFSQPVTGNQYKVYVLSDAKTILYVGATKSSIRNRLRYGLNANGQNGYHGYKWKDYKKVTLFVWCFDDLEKTAIENIEAELVFYGKKGVWSMAGMSK